MLDDLAGHATRTKYARGGLKSLTKPVVEGLGNPLANGVGRGVAGAASDTQRAADLLGDFVDTVCPLFPEPHKKYFDRDLTSQLFHVSGGVFANTEKGVCILF